jgi:hypothetical protein
MPITNAVLAQKMSEMIDAWRNRELEMQAWVTGTATGGPGSDGKYPLTTYLGDSILTKSPARLEADVSGLVDSASAYAAAALAAQLAAETAETNAETAETNALSYRNSAASHRDTAVEAASQAGTYAAAASGAYTNATAQAAAAAASAAAALASEIAAGDSEDAAGVSETNAAASAAAAAASAAAAATFDPANFYTKTAADALFSLIGHTHDYVQQSTTGLGLTGNVSLNNSLTNAAAWAALPVGYSRMLGYPGGSGVPLSDYGYFTKIANRDGFGGWGGLWMPYGGGRLFIGAAYTSGDLPGWTEVWTTGNDGSGSGLDADMVDGIDSTRIIYGGTGSSGSWTAPATFDAFNSTMYKSGFWEAQGASWTPTTDWWWGLTCAHTSNNSAYNYSAQIIHNLSGTEQYFRSIINGTPQSWKRQYHSGNVTAGTAAPSGGSDGDIYFQYT